MSLPESPVSACPPSPLDIYGSLDELLTMARENDALQGTLDLLVLKTLAQLGEMHGFGIALHIQQVSSDGLRVEEGSLYPALRRIEQAGWVAAEWQTTENNRRAKYYHLTAAGRRQLAHEERNWAQLVKGVTAVLGHA
jgi:PadR family transcriptional regulator, regulatory protein PadR